jgi:undecaprenyl diphosphate synthase
MKESLDKEKIPHHIAIIMDGNGRWAQQKGAMRIFGHKNAINAGLVLTNQLDAILTSTARNILLYTRIIASLSCDADL